MGLLQVKQGSVRLGESVVTPAAPDASKTFHKIRAFPINAEPHFTPAMKATRASFSRTASFPSNTHIKVFGMEVADPAQWMVVVDPDACRIGPRLVTAFRRRRGSKQPVFVRSDTRTGPPRPCGEGLRCAPGNLTRFSLGAPQALTLVGHTSAHSRRATTDRSGLIAMVPGGPVAGGHGRFGRCLAESGDQSEPIVARIHFPFSTDRFPPALFLVSPAVQFLTKYEGGCS
jgi:hypothetical protein